MTDQGIVQVLEMCWEWLDNVERQQGKNALLDAMPNDCCGRFAIYDAIEELKRRSRNDKANN